MKTHKKNIVHPGYIISKNDNEEHFISGAKLIELYKLDTSETIIAEYNESNLRGLNLNNFEHFYPRFDGKYNSR